MTAINMEMMNTAIAMILTNIPTGNAVVFDTTPEAGVSYFEHKQQLKDAIAQAEAKMVSSAGRGTISAMMSGVSQCAIIQTLPGFERLVDGAPVGPHIFGKLDGVTIVRVPNNNVLDADLTIGIYRGTSPFEAAFVYSPFMPLVVTTTLPTGLNPLLHQRAAAVWAGMEILVKNFSVKITGTDV